jgi:endonuclease/exonuclease/phosphatase (EEP) superfamily protein YafD
MRSVCLLSLTAVLGVMVADRTARADEPARSLRLLTYNVNYANPDVGATVSAIAAVDADVVLLQEITTEWQRALVARLARVYPHRVFRIHSRAPGGLAVLSKLPVRDEEQLPSPNHTWFPAERFVVATPLGDVQILNVHLRPAVEGDSWVKGFFTTPPLRLREIEAYWPKLAQPMPTVVAGDFNEDATGSALAFLVKHGLARVATTGPKTWHYEIKHGGKTSDGLAMDIDHVLLDGSLVARDARVLDAGTSDHRPVVVTIAAKP